MSTIRQTLMLRPMQSGVSGYARMQQEGGRTVVQLHARGLPEGEGRLYWYLSGQMAREMAAGKVNPRGEIALTAETPEDAVAPGRLQALILLTGGEKPQPLLIGLCAESSAGSILDAKNAALALCDKLQKRKLEPAPAPAPPPVRPVAKTKPIPREIFLPAIDPSPYVQPSPPPPSPMRGKPVGRLKPMRFPRGFESLRSYFQQQTPVRLFELPGWRFVPAADGLWVGIEPVDGRVTRVAYAYRQKPRGPGKYQAKQGVDGQIYHVLWQTL